MPLDIGKWDIGKWLRGAHVVENIFGRKEGPIEVGPGTKVDEAVKKAIEVGQDVKKWVNNPIEDLFMHLLPKWAQEAEGKVEKFTPIILAGLLNLSNPLGMQQTLQQVKFTDNFFWDKFWKDFAVALANVMLDGQINFADLSTAVQFAKDHLFPQQQQNG